MPTPTRSARSGSSSSTSTSSSIAATGAVAWRAGAIAVRSRIVDRAAILPQLARALRRHPHTVRDRQRIIGRDHVDPGQRAPRSADQVERPARAAVASPLRCSAARRIVARAALRRRRRQHRPAARRAAATMPVPASPPSTSTSSRLPPPRSPTMPSAPGIAVQHAFAGQPRLVAAALSTSAGEADGVAPRATNSAPSAASRTAAVATTWTVRRRPCGRSAGGSAAARAAPGRWPLADRRPVVASSCAEPGQHLFVEDRRRAPVRAPA